MSRPTAAHLTALAFACVAFTIATPYTSSAQGSATPGAGARQQSSREVQSPAVAQQLGVRFAPGQAEELAIGTSLTGSLVDPARLASFGVSDVKVGARVSILRMGQEKVRVEIDEVDPVPRSRGMTLRLHADGRLGVPAQ